MGRILGMVVVIAAMLGLQPTLACAEVVSESVEYEVDGQMMVGYVAYDAAMEGERPGVLVVPEWWGLNEYAKRRAREMAAMGYVGFAADMVGQGNVTSDPKEAGAWAGEMYNNRTLWRTRAAAALDALKAQPQVDPDRLAAIGFCFGGATVMELAYSGADLDAVVSFHGNPKPMPEADHQNLRAQVMILSGAADPMETMASLEKVTQSLDEADADWVLVRYAHAQHSFTNPDADSHNIPGVKYDERAAVRSWRHMAMFIRDAFEQQLRVDDDRE